MSRAVPDRLRDILDAIDRCLAYQESMMSTDSALAVMAQDAVLRNIGVIGEAVNHLPAELTGRHPEIEWAAIVGMRNIVVHEYFRVDAVMLSDVLDTDLRHLAGILTSELDNEQGCRPRSGTAVTPITRRRHARSAPKSARSGP